MSMAACEFSHTVHACTALLAGWHPHCMYLVKLSHSAHPSHINSRTAVENGSDLGGDGAGRMSYVRALLLC